MLCRCQFRFPKELTTEFRAAFPKIYSLATWLGLYASELKPRAVREGGSEVPDIAGRLFPSHTARGSPLIKDTHAAQLTLASVKPIWGTALSNLGQEAGYCDIQGVDAWAECVKRPT
jgi:hypothetical protein